MKKRHNFGGQRMTHGVKKCHRHAGSTGCSAYPSRVQKGLRSSGQYGNTRCTTRNIKIVKADKKIEVTEIQALRDVAEWLRVDVALSERIDNLKIEEVWTWGM